MGGPGGGGDQIAVNVRLVDANIRIMPAAESHFGSASRVSATGTAFKNTRGGQKLRAMANGSNRFMRGVESLDQFNHLLIQAQIFWRAAAGDQQGVVVLFSGAGKIGVQYEAVTGFSL